MCLFYEEIYWLLFRLLNTLTKALQNSGVDLSQANISVHVDLGKRSNGKLNSSASTLKVSNSVL